MKDYELIDHTADLGIKVYGKDLKGLFINSAAAMFDVMLEIKEGIESTDLKYEKFVVNQTARCIDEVLVAWLSEILYLFSTEGLVMQKAEIEKIESTVIHSELSGVIFKDNLYRIKTEIKAVTYHGLEIIQNNKGYQAQVIFDI